MTDGLDLFSGPVRVMLSKALEAVPRSLPGSPFAYE